MPVPRWEGPLERIDGQRWRLPKSYKPGMRVDGMIYADDEMMEAIRSDKAAEQVANVAFLPGIVKYSLAMPDIHWGYGFPIGGVAATDIDAEGVVAPGGIGFDINCLSNSLIINELGYRRYIKDYEEDFYNKRLVSMDFNEEKAVDTAIKGFLKQKPKKQVLNIVTETNRQIEATSDHPFYTKNGMKEIGKLSKGDEVAIYPFEGVEYEEPPADIIVDRGDIERLFLRLGKSSKGNSLNQILRSLARKNLLPIRYDSWQLPYLIKIMGYCFGDGLVYFDGKRKKGTVCFYGKENDLEKIKEDLNLIGVPGSIYSRPRHHKIRTAYSLVEFDTKEFVLKATSNSFAILLASLGMPIGNKCRQSYDMPGWLFKAALWQKRLFLAGFFGAEMSSPKTMTGHGYNFYCPTISMNKTLPYIENGREFLEDAAQLLKEFDVSCHDISERKEFVNKEGIVSYRLRLMISDKAENLMNLYCKVGFEYNEERKFLANVAAGYLRLKENIIREKKEVSVLAPALASTSEWDREQLYDYLKSPYVTERFIERSLYEERKTDPRMWGECPTFEEFLKTATEGLGRSGMVW
ncbi:MAG: RtcB family protein, partial [Candidatus Omnitrophica bacterium]|nr:RtcB family protein [Candidatus Omnitrophota bacterium]